MAGSDLPVGRGWATGVGSFPGTDPREAVAVVVGELPDLPHLPELPARGPGADLVGRGAGLLVDLQVDLQPSGWRLVDRPSREGRRASAYLSADLDALEEAAQRHTGPVKVQVAGPWTLAAALRLPRGEPVLTDEGATRDVAASLAEGVALHVQAVRRRLPAASVVLQIDEPSLPAVLAGRIRTTSGLYAVAAVADHAAESALRAVVEAAEVPVVAHCCAVTPPVALMHRAGIGAVSVDLLVAGRAVEDQLAELVEDGGTVLAGLVPAVDAPLSEAVDTVEPLRQLWRRVGLSAEALATQVVVTPTCGLAGASPAHARAALQLARAAAAVLVDDPEG